MNADALRKRNADPGLFTAADRQEALQFAPGAPLVGAYATTVAGAPVVEIDFRNGRLCAKLPGSTTWVALATEDGPIRFRGESPTQDLVIEFETVDGTATLLPLDSGAGHPRMKLVWIR